MSAVDTSALMAILLGEPTADACAEVLEAESDIVISAGTLAEALIVASRRNVATAMRQLIEDLGFQVIPLTEASAHRVAEIYGRWGKGRHPAGLNFGDCFAYDIATFYGCKLFYVGVDFSLTDVESASPNPARGQE